MLEKHKKLIIGLVAFLVVANIIYYIYAGWGLITVKVTDAPLGKVIKSIEWQGWVKIYSSLDPDTKVTMNVDHVPLAEAMATLAVNVNGQWKLGFFAAPTAAEVKQQIAAFQAGSDKRGKDDDVKIYTYPTMLDMIAADSEASASDPREQSWPGMKPAPATPPPAPAAGDGNASPDASASPKEQDKSEEDPHSVRHYLKAFAKAADIWIMVPKSWEATVPADPAPNSSIAGAVSQLVKSAGGSVTQAIILRSSGGPRGIVSDGGRGGGNFYDDDDQWNAMTDRIRNAIKGLPPEEREDATSELENENSFRKSMKSVDPKLRKELTRKHVMEKMARMGGRMARMAPEKRAQMYQRMVAARIAVTGH